VSYAILFLVIPLFSAFLAPLGSLIRAKFGNVLNLLIYAAGVAIGIVLFAGMEAGGQTLAMGGWSPPFGINLYLSPVSVGFGILVYLIALFIHVSDLGSGRTARYNLLFSLFVFASLGMMQTGDLFNLFIFVEISSIAVIALAPAVSGRAGTRGAVKYLVPSGLLSMFMLASIALLYSSLGTLNIAHVASSDPLNGALGLVLGIGLMAVLFFETELFPFNSWVPEVYKGASSSFSGAIAGIGGLSGAVVLGRLFLTMMGPDTSFSLAHDRLLIVVFVVGAASVLLGEFAALRERDLKKVLAFSSVGQMGVVALTFTVGGMNALHAGLFLLLNHSIVKPLLLILAGFFIGVTGTSKWSEMTGVARQSPLFGVLFIAGGLSLMGMPVFAGFWAKMTFLKALFDQASPFAAAVAGIVLLSSVVEGIYFLRIGHSFFERDSAEDADADQDRTRLNVHTPVYEKPSRLKRTLVFIPSVVLALGTVVLGLRPGLLYVFLQGAADDLLNTTAYIGNILVSATTAGGGL
jgi:formate hydrogenlyase subunit 3/multisubunit Na+/H+ antiporter MnhD subunit